MAQAKEAPVKGRAVSVEPGIVDQDPAPVSKEGIVVQRRRAITGATLGKKFWPC